MKWRANCESLKNRYFEIKYDQLAGYYFYVFEDNKCIRDYLQDTLEIAMECAWEDYGIPKNAWMKVND